MDVRSLAARLCVEEEGSADDIGHALLVGIVLVIFVGFVLWTFAGWVLGPVSD